MKKMLRGINGAQLLLQMCYKICFTAHLRLHYLEISTILRN